VEKQSLSGKCNVVVPVMSWYSDHVLKIITATTCKVNVVSLGGLLHFCELSVLADRCR